MQLLPILRPSALAAAALLAAPILAGTPGGFRAGDLYLYSPAIFGLSSGNAGILRIDATGGGGQPILGPFGAVALGAQQLAYDPWRERLVVAAVLGGVTDLYLVSADGTTQSLGLPGESMRLLAPTGDGRIYLRRASGPLSGIQYVDAAGVLHDLMDATGTAPFELVPGQSDLAGAMIHEPVTDSLFIATHANWAKCAGGTPTEVNFHRIPLSPDGSRVAGPVACGQFDVDSSSTNEDPVAFAHAPGGRLILFVDTNSNLQQCRMVSIDPVTLGATPFACNGGYQAAASNAGTFAPTRGQAVVLDTGGDVLRAFGAGDSGPGFTLPATGVSPPGSSGEDAALVAIGPAPARFGLTSGVTGASLSAGGSQILAIDAGPARAGAIYWVLGSATGWTPGFAIAGTPIGLRFDAYTVFTLQHPNTPVLPGSLGLLDGNGRSAASFALPAGADPGLAGAVLHHVATTLDPVALLADWSSNPVALELLP